eukprot:TRINITY_DN3447_c0_g1_i1.p1 TRINITY_DN3447_c0_g1~~TRINITY_DN3447_c0_g1_i1.p1  ORF type:complete len:457 (+),score=71.78 TRINITY_DN3447_c0_g1_i1:125-1495(+)
MALQTSSVHVTCRLGASSLSSPPVPQASCQRRIPPLTLSSSVPSKKDELSSRSLRGMPGTPYVLTPPSVLGAAATSSETAKPTLVTMRGDDDTADVSHFIRPHLRDLAAYKPIEPFDILSARLGIPMEDIVKLDANENPYGPPPEVLQALGEMQFAHIYPDPQSRVLREALAADCGLSADHLLVGCGADELLDLLMRCTLEPGDAILDCPPTFTMYAFDAAVNAGRVVKVPRNADFSVNVDAVVEAVERERPKLLFLTSPNNPDGSMLSEAALLRLLQLPVLVVLDEAYIEFSEEKSHIQWVRDYGNLIVLRTFSKRAGLAGLRVGYGAFPLALIKYIWRAKQPYNVSIAAQVAATAALGQPAYLKQVKDALLEERSRLFSLLEEVPFLRPYPSHANFILCSVTGDRSAGAVQAELERVGIMVRYYDKPDLRGFIRISVGKPEQTDRLMEELRKLI